jgi:outer membrane protein assembly factor BamB
VLRRALVLLTLPLLAPSAAAALEPRPRAAWPMARHDAKGTGRAPIVGRSAPGLRPWSVRTGKGIFNTAAVDGDGTAYVGSADGTLYAIGRRGRVRWRFPTGGIIDAGAVLTRDSLIVGSGDETLYRLRLGARTRDRVVWRVRTPVKPATGQLVSWWEGPGTLAPDGDLLIGNTGGGAHRIASDGTVRWVHQRGNSVWSAPAVGDDGSTYWGSVDLNVFSLDRDGRVRWTLPTLGFVTASPAIGSDGTVYTASFDGKVYALDPATGLPRWTFATRDHVYGGPALAQDPAGRTSVVVVGSADGGLYGLDARTGAQRWRFDTADAVRSSPAIGLAPDGREIAYAGSSNGRLYAIDVGTGRRRWSFDTTPADPVLADRNDLNSSPALGPDGVVIGSETGDVWRVPYDFCLRARDRRCSTEPGDELPAEATRLTWVTPGGSTLLGGPAGPVPPASTLTTRLVVRREGQTVDAAMVALPTARALARPAPGFAFDAQTSGDGRDLHVVPDGLLAPDTAYELRAEGLYTADGVPVGNTVVGATRGGRFAGSVRFRTAPLRRGPTVAAGRESVSAVEIRRLAVPLPPLLPSVNQIGFDSYDLIGGFVRVGPRQGNGDQRVLLWVVGGRRDARGRLVGDPAGGFAFPLEGTLRGDQFLLRNDGITLRFSFGDVPLRRFELRGAWDRRLTSRPGSALYGEVTCLDVPNYGPGLLLTGICNQTGTLVASGTFLTQRYDRRGGASSRPRGVRVGAVTLRRPTDGEDGEVTAPVSSGPGWDPARHVLSILLTDAATGRPVGLDYAKLSAFRDGRVTVRLPAGTALPERLRATVLADVFPLAETPLP